ncbi:MAG: hypothetical protein HZA08_05950 [Nitrospirae bacterium]|nr:hypothetical protein [Nitrospirota bacterium]
MPKKDIRDMTDKEIIIKLKNLGILISVEDFKGEALKAGSPTDLADYWKVLFGIRNSNEEFLYDATFELWRRHLSDVKCPEMLALFIDETVNMYVDKPYEHDRFSILNIYERIKDFYQGLIKEDGMPDVDLYNRLTLLSYNDFEAFLINIPFQLARQGFVDEAVNVGRWFGELSSQPENFLRDTGCILAEAGRRGEALLQIDENLLRFPNDNWVVINAGDAMYSLGEKEGAEKFYLRAYNIAREQYDKAGVIERLIDLYKELGLTDKVEAFEKEYNDIMKS